MNTVTGHFDTAEVKDIQILPTGISKDADGNNVLDGEMVFYRTVNGPVLAATEVFASADEAKKHWTEVLASL